MPRLFSGLFVPEFDNRMNTRTPVPRKRVVLINNAYWPSIGGVENSIRHLAYEAKAAGHDVCIVASDIGLSPGSDVSSHEPAEVTILRYKQEPIRSRLLKPLNVLLSAWQLFRIARKLHRSWPNAVVIARHHFGAIAARAAGFRRIRYLVPSIVALQVRVETGGHDLSNSMLESCRRRLFVLLHTLTQRYAIRVSEVFVFSRTMRRQCEELMGRKLEELCTITKPGVDRARFYPIAKDEVAALRRVLGIPISNPIVLFVGRFVKAKRATDILHAVASIPECHTVFVGTGPEISEYRRLIKHLHLESRVSIFGPSNEVERYYRCADVFVMSSSYEPLGQTILEALCSGLIVAAYRCSEVDTATEELGMDDFFEYADEFSVASLADAIRRAIATARCVDRVYLSNVAAERFSWARLYQQLTE